MAHSPLVYYPKSQDQVCVLNFMSMAMAVCLAYLAYGRQPINITCLME